MTKSKLALAVCAALVCWPLSAANAVDLDAPLAASGKEFTAPAGIGGENESPAYRGKTTSLSESVIEDALSSAPGGTMSASEFALLNSLEPVSAPDGIESIIGADQRKQVSNTKKFPYRAVVLITFSDGGNGYRCTGWLINANTVVTAGHCVYDPGVGFFSEFTYTIFPGANGASKPYGSCKAVDLYTVNGWANSGLDDYDYGAIKLNCNVGNTTGWFGYFFIRGRSALKGLPTIITGFPGDKPLTMWLSKGKVTRSQPRRVFYKNDTTGGMSGSPVYYKRSGCGWCSMAVHAYGVYGSGVFSRNNHGTRITKGVYRNLNLWKKQ